MPCSSREKAVSFASISRSPAKAVKIPQRPLSRQRQLRTTTPATFASGSPCTAMPARSASRTSNPSISTYLTLRSQTLSPLALAGPGASMTPPGWARKRIGASARPEARTRKPA